MDKHDKSIGRPSLEKEIERISEENQLKRYGFFLEKHDAMLVTIENSLDNDSSVKYDIFNSPLVLGFQPQDDVTTQQLVNSENKLLNKLLETLTFLCREATNLEHEARTKYYLQLMIYGEGITNELEATNSDSLRVGKMLKVLQDLHCFVKRCQVVAVEFVTQINCLYKTEQLQFITSTGVHFQDVFSHLANILVILVTFDEIMSGSALLEQWGMYRKTVKSVHHNYSTFQMDLGKLNALDNVLNTIEQELLSDKIFQNTLEQCCKLEINKTGKHQKILMSKFLFYLKNIINELEKLDVDTVDCLQAPEWVKLNALFVLYQYLFESVEKRFFKQVWEVNKKVSGVTLIGNVLWYPEQFLLRHCSSVKGFDMKLVQASSKVRQAYLTHKAQSLLKDTHTYSLQTSLWIIQMNAVFKEGVSRIKLEHLKMRCSLLLKGVKFACRMSQIVKCMTNLHLSQGRPMTKSCLLAVCKIIELLKAVQHTFFDHFNRITESIHCIIQHLSYQALNIISVTKKSITKDKSFLKKHTAVLSSLNIAEMALFGPGTPERLLLARLALASCDVSQAFTDEHLTKLLKHMDHLNLICKLQENLSKICDCSFLYWHQVIIPIYFSNLFDGKTDMMRISYMLHALNDFSIPENNCMVSYNASTEESLKENVLEPLCHHIETNLRLHIHSHLQLDSTNPFAVPIDDCRTLIHSKPLRLGDKYIDIKGYIEHYLNNMFYNLTTVVLHDWKTYGEMRRLALEKYALKTVEDHLPTQTLEQGLDILEIMRNIHVFVSKYLYNLNNQIFVEQWSNNKHLNTINIRHVANSIRTHGTGIMNTTVNFTYQFLRNKFYIFSQFMYDEQIKSRLLKDMRYFREHKTETDPCYNYDRADAFNKAIRKLGLSKLNQSYLDLFRLQISHIGNAMGYVRMIRSGGLHCCSNASVFLPSLDENLTFEELCTSDNLSEPTCEAARNLVHDVKNLAVNFAEGTEYFKLLVDVFAPVFRNPKNMHLKNFYIIVPPLTINFIEYLITSKDKMTKKDKSGAAFTDDGFAMGLAYILKLLNQNAELDSLHWFQSVRLKYNQQKQSLYQQRQLASKDDDKLQQTLALTEKRLIMFQQEFELLYYNFNSARIFFQ